MSFDLAGALEKLYGTVDTSSKQLQDAIDSIGSDKPASSAEMLRLQSQMQSFELAVSTVSTVVKEYAETYKGVIQRIS